MKKLILIELNEINFDLIKIYSKKKSLIFLMMTFYLILELHLQKIFIKR